MVCFYNFIDKLPHDHIVIYTIAFGQYMTIFGHFMMFILPQTIVFSCTGVIKSVTTRSVTNDDVKQLALNIFDRNRCGSKKWHKVFLVINYNQETGIPQHQIVSRPLDYTTSTIADKRKQMHN